MDTWTRNLRSDIFPTPTGASVELERRANHTLFLENQIKGGQCRGQGWQRSPDTHWQGSWTRYGDARVTKVPDAWVLGGKSR